MLQSNVVPTNELLSMARKNLLVRGIFRRNNRGDFTAQISIFVAHNLHGGKIFLVEAMLHSNSEFVGVARLDIKALSNSPAGSSDSANSSFGDYIRNWTPLLCRGDAVLFVDASELPDCVISQNRLKILISLLLIQETLRAQGNKEGIPPVCYQLLLERVSALVLKSHSIVRTVVEVL
jgi:hypothetical protein